MIPLTPTAVQAVKDRARSLALDLGACACGVAAPDAPRHRARLLSSWLAGGLHAHLEYMERTAEIRRDVRHWWPETESVLCVAVPYALPPDRAQPGCGRIAGYALGPDYHKVLFELLERVALDLTDFLDKTFPFQIAVDSAPVAERSLAASCGVGVVARNGQLLVPHWGSAVVLGELALPFPLTPDPPLAWDPCKGCHLCVEACPTGALKGPLVDATKCLSYWTTEQRGPIPRQVAADISGRILGCDTCQLACPHNQSASKAPLTCDRIEDWNGSSPYLELTSLFDMGGKALGRKLKSTALERLGASGLWRNALAAAWRTAVYRRVAHLARRKNSPLVALQRKKLEM